MPTPDSTISLVLNGKAHTNWTRYEIDSDLLTPADGFILDLGLPLGEIPPEAHVGATIEVRVGKDVVLTGYIDDKKHRVDKTGQKLSLNGRDGAAILLDCSAPIFNAQDMSLADIVNKLVKPLGISKIKLATDGAESAKKVQIEPGMSAWDALALYAETNGVWPWFEPDGTLIVGGPDYTAKPVADLIMRRNGQGNNVVRLEEDKSMSGRYSEVTVLAQSHAGKNGLKAVVKDESVKIHRPIIITDGDIDSNALALKRGRKFLADSRLKGLTLTALVKGHRTSDGILWTPGQRIHVLSEPHGIDEVYFLMARTFMGGRDDAGTTQLKLKEDGAWVLDANSKKTKSADGKDKNKKRNKRRKKKKADAGFGDYVDWRKE